MSTRTEIVEAGARAVKPIFTERQERAFPKAIAEAQKYVETSTIPDDLWQWIVRWDDETRPGRGYGFTGMWSDGEYLVEVHMDVYGHPTVSIAETYWVHNSADEQCECEPCVKEVSDV